ncbi:hypothetical protein WD019_00785 [Fictibacillus sp. Mic-4]|uniref:hypothetical protein n=1 Tax=Fictibacillus sp. Mic-4 TaxID=3132826 RepID=UPI003CF0760B
MNKRMSKNILHPLVGCNVKINLGGPESKKGTLMCCKDDHCVLLSEDGDVLYYQHEHIKSVTKHSQDYSGYDNGTSYIDCDSFHTICKNMKYKWVKINRGGPESVEGVITHIHDDHLVLVVKEEVIYVPIYHIQSLNEIEKKDDDKSSGKSSGNGRSSNKGSGNRRSGGGRSGNRRSDGRRSGNRRSDGRRTGNRRSDSRRTGERRSDGGRRRSFSEVHEAVKKAHVSGTHRYMFRDPEESSSKRSMRSWGGKNDPSKAWITRMC